MFCYVLRCVVVLLCRLPRLLLAVGMLWSCSCCANLFSCLVVMDERERECFISSAAVLPLSCWYAVVCRVLCQFVLMIVVGYGQEREREIISIATAWWRQKARHMLFLDFH
jgi:hypothetical protein